MLKGMHRADKGPLSATGGGMLAACARHEEVMRWAQ